MLGSGCSTGTLWGPRVVTLPCGALVEDWARCNGLPPKAIVHLQLDYVRLNVSAARDQRPTAGPDQA